MGTIHGNLRRYPSDVGNEGFICTEKSFGTAKENHGFRYTQMYGKARMEMKVGLTYACMNLKKLAKIKEKRGLLKERKTLRNLILYKICFIKEKLLWDVNSRATLSTV